MPFNLHKYSKLENLKNLEMFDTFGLEDKITRSFVRHYKELLKKEKPDRMEMFFKKRQSIQIGSSLLGNAIDPIIEKYGKPKLNFPKKIDFMIIHENHPLAGKGRAFFLYRPENFSFIIGIYLNSIFDFNIKNISYSIGHELQHFLMSIYGKKTSPKYNPNDPKTMTVKGYYGDDWEVQAYSYEIAKTAINTINDVYIFGTRNMGKTPQNAIKILNKIEQNKINFVTTYINTELKIRIESIEKQKKEQMPNELKQKYYLATINNFKNLFNKWIENKRNELMN